MAGVGALQQQQVRILPQRCRQLAVTAIDTDDLRRAALQHTVGESAGGGADVKTNSSCEIDLPMVERGCEFQSAAADVGKGFSLKLNVLVWIDEKAGFGNDGSVDGNVTGGDSLLSAGTGWSESALEEQFIETKLHAAPLFAPE